jgi:hypothetical protein
MAGSISPFPTGDQRTPELFGEGKIFTAGLV